jgi:glycosyltransferase involved in cell wall biosynthesis
VSRVLLIGTGPLPEDGPRELGFPQLRARQFLLPLLEAGHDVMLVTFTRRDLVTPQDEAAVHAPVPRALTVGGRSADLSYAVVRPDEPGRFLRVRDLRHAFAPDVIVTAGPFLPLAAGARAAGDEPLWIDVPGDPMCEAQAKALRSGSTDPIHRYRQMLGQALARGDRFSVISRTQRGSLIGALGLAGRLTAAAVGHELVHVVPGSVEGLPSAGDAPLPGAYPDLPPGALPALFCGGYNNWLDGETLLAGLLSAMDGDPRIHFVSTGGALPGHDESTYHRFRAGAAASVHAARFHFLGWIPLQCLPAVFSRAWLSLSVDRPCYEAEFGARTRILESLERGVPVVSTDLCDLTHELTADGLVHATPVGDAAALGSLLLDLARGEVDLGPGDRWERLRGRYGLAETTAALLDWVDAPSRAEGGVPVDFLDDSWQELARLQDRLEEVWKSPTWRTLGRVHQLLKRLR